MRAPMSWLRDLVAIPADQTGRDVAARVQHAHLPGRARDLAVLHHGGHQPAECGVECGQRTVELAGR